jgi:polysaccharide export outer membrane protein
MNVHACVTEGKLPAKQQNLFGNSVALVISKEAAVQMRFQLRIRLFATIFALGALPITALSQQIADAPASSNVEGSNVTGVTDVTTSAGTERHTKSPDQLSQYAIGPADVLHINVWKNAELSQTLTVDPDGFISVPLLGDIHVAGLTTNQLATQLASSYKSYVVSPQVTVSVTDIRSRQVYVMGQVGKAGGYPLIAPISVLQLIAQAGGLNTYAKRKDIYVLRAQNGQTQKLPFNYEKVTHGDTKQNIMLQPGDTVIVP